MDYFKLFKQVEIACFVISESFQNILGYTHDSYSYFWSPIWAVSSTDKISIQQTGEPPKHSRWRHNATQNAPNFVTGLPKSPLEPLVYTDRRLRSITEQVTHDFLNDLSSLIDAVGNVERLGFGMSFKYWPMCTVFWPNNLNCTVLRYGNKSLSWTSSCRWFGFPKLPGVKINRNVVNGLNRRALICFTWLVFYLPLWNPLKLLFFFNLKIRFISVVVCWN